jgi:hypothetical protein
MALALGGFVGLCRLLLHCEQAPAAWLHFAGGFLFHALCLPVQCQGLLATKY